MKLSELEEDRKKCKTLLELVEDEELADPMLISVSDGTNAID